jgi:hypothetical protein
MIAVGIAAVFILIGYFEWLYLTRDKQKKRTLRIVLGLDLFFLLAMETLYLLRERFSLGEAMNVVLAPIQQWLFAGS